MQTAEHPVPLRTADTKALKAVWSWLWREFVIRNMLIVPIIVALGGSTKTPDILPRGGFLGMITLAAIAQLVLANFFMRKRIREQLTVSDLGYGGAEHNIGRGLLGGAIMLLVVHGSILVSAHVFPGLASAAERYTKHISQDGVMVASLFLLINGVLVPLVEEYAWRGYIQTRFTRAWGAWVGITVTALIFTAKHAIVDLSVDRVIIHLTLALGLGVVRQFWGTTESTIVHMMVNLATTSLLITAAF